MLPGSAACVASTRHSRPCSDGHRASCAGLHGPEISSASQGKIELLLRYQPPYDWPSILEFLRRRAIPGIERVTEQDYARTLRLNGSTGTVTIKPAHDRDALRVVVRFPILSALPAIIARVRRVFDLAADPVPITAHLAKDPALAPLVLARPGLRVPGAWDGFELAIRAVLGQQITVVAAATLAGRLVASYGDRLAEPDGTLTHVFPTPTVLAEAELTSLGLPRARAAALSAVAAAALADPNLFDATSDLGDAVKRLRAIPGVGEWTAQYIALRQLREPDAFPAADLGLLRAMANQDGFRHSSSELLDRAEPWRPWRAYAAQHLWASQR